MYEAPVVVNFKVAEGYAFVLSVKHGNNRQVCEQESAKFFRLLAFAVFPELSQHGRMFLLQFPNSESTVPEFQQYAIS